MEKAVRLDKFLADAGCGTRSEVKNAVRKGLVTVNGVPAKKPEQKILQESDTVAFSGKKISAAPEFVYYLLNKPAGCVSATEDSRDHTVMEYVPSERKGLFPVGRLDKDTEGLLLITDDGALAHALLSPSRHVEKTYFVRVEGELTEEACRILETGVDIGEEKLTLPARAKILAGSRYGGIRQEKDGISGRSELPAESSAEQKSAPKAEAAVPPAYTGERIRPLARPENLPEKWTELHLTIHEGKFHQVKRMLAAVGCPVVYLKRISMGSLTLPPDLKKGECRPLTEKEVKELLQSDRRPEL